MNMGESSISVAGYARHILQVLDRDRDGAIRTGSETGDSTGKLDASTINNGMALFDATDKDGRSELRADTIIRWTAATLDLNNDGYISGAAEAESLQLVLETMSTWNGSGANPLDPQLATETAARGVTGIQGRVHSSGVAAGW